jgi:MerR family transcriptional regulator, heat shock protein HspR
VEKLLNGLPTRFDEMARQLLDAQAAAEQTAATVHASYRRDLVPYEQRQALVVWRPKRSSGS